MNVDFFMSLVDYEIPLVATYRAPFAVVGVDTYVKTSETILSAESVFD
jgi:hypothetical protein